MMPVERETIIDTGGGGGGAGIIIAVIAALVLVALLVWGFNGGLFGSNGGATVDVDVPAVTVTPDGQ